MPTIEVEVEVKCERCGADLTMSSSATSRGNTHVIAVEPCDDCLSKSHDEGYNLAECELEG